jgi:hypothetical protein
MARLRPTGIERRFWLRSRRGLNPESRSNSRCTILAIRLSPSTALLARATFQAPRTVERVRPITTGTNSTLKSAETTSGTGNTD